MSRAGRCFRAVVIGGSTGGIPALRTILTPLPKAFPLPVLVVLHLPNDPNSALASLLNKQLTIGAIEAADKQPITPGSVYLAPPGYHLLAERDATLALDAGAPCNFARPSIDVLFESAALVWSQDLIAVLLSGANADGALGMRAVHERGGLNIAQDPATAAAPAMPQAAMDLGVVDEVLAPDAIAERLLQLAASTEWIPPARASDRE